MAAKIKIGNVICETKNGVWSCAEVPELATSLQELCDGYFAKPDEYVVDIDEQGALLAVRMAKAQILEITAPEPDDPDAVVF